LAGAKSGIAAGFEPGGRRQASDWGRANPRAVYFIHDFNDLRRTTEAECGKNRDFAEPFTQNQRENPVVA
jgi:hypothetical protein